MSDALERPRLLCRCLGVASHRVVGAAREQGLQDVADVTKATRAGSGCTMCHPEIEEILQTLRGEPVDPIVAMENRIICAQETHARVEGSLESLIRPRLEAIGARLEGFEVDGLTVRLALAGAAEEGLALAREKLRKYVCRDLAVEALEPKDA